MEEINKSNEQLHEEFEETLQILSEKIYALLHFGSYQLEYVSRNIESNAVDWADMKVGKHRIHLCDGSIYGGGEGTEVTVCLPDNPVSKELLDMWDRQTIQRQIDYHKGQIDGLLKRKEEMDSL